MPEKSETINARILPTPQEAADAIRAAVADILDRHEDCARDASRILRSLSIMEQGFRSPTPAPAVGDSGTPQTAQIHRRNKLKRYARESVAGEEMLSEYRQDSPFPFRCPKRVLDAVVAIIDSAAQPLVFADIQAAAAKRLGDVPPVYQLRVCLRFLTGPDHPLIKRHRSRFSSGRVRSLKKMVEQRWTDLARQSM